MQSLAHRLQWPAAAACGVALTAWLFHPGLMSVDSMYQFSQVLGLRPLDDIHPPLYVLLWRPLHALVPGPAGMFWVTALVWWSALAWIVFSRMRSRWRWLVVLAIGAWPPALLMLGHLWKDVAMAAALLLAVAGIAGWRDGRGRAAFAVALVGLALACALRHNGLFAALPLLPWLLWPRARAPGRSGLSRIGAATLALALALALLPTALAGLTGAMRTDAWTAVLLWDLAPLSIAADRILYPPELVAADLSIQELERSYVPWANPPLFASGRIRLGFYKPLRRHEREAVVAAWWRAVRNDPATWLRHRNAMFAHLLLGFDRDLPRELVYVPERRVPAEAGLELPPVDTGRVAFRLYERLRSTPLFAAWPYLLAALLAPIAAARRRAMPWASLALSASAFANAVPLWLIAGSAEFRYLLWTVLAAALAWLFALTAPPATLEAVPGNT